MTRKYRLLYREMGVIPTIMTPFLRYFLQHKWDEREFLIIPTDARVYQSGE